MGELNDKTGTKDDIQKMKEEGFQEEEDSFRLRSFDSDKKEIRSRARKQVYTQKLESKGIKNGVFYDDSTLTSEQAELIKDGVIYVLSDPESPCHADNYRFAYTRSDGCVKLLNLASILRCSPLFKSMPSALDQWIWTVITAHGEEFETCLSNGIKWVRLRTETRPLMNRDFTVGVGGNTYEFEYLFDPHGDGDNEDDGIDDIYDDSMETTQSNERKEEEVDGSTAERHRNEKENEGIEHTGEGCEKEESTKIDAANSIAEEKKNDKRTNDTAAELRDLQRDFPFSMSIQNDKCLPNFIKPQYWVPKEDIPSVKEPPIDEDAADAHTNNIPLSEPFSKSRTIPLKPPPSRIREEGAEEDSGKVCPLKKPEVVGTTPASQMPLLPPRLQVQPLLSPSQLQQHQQEQEQRHVPPMPAPSPPINMGTSIPKAPPAPRQQPPRLCPVEVFLKNKEGETSKPLSTIAEEPGPENESHPMVKSPPSAPPAEPASRESKPHTMSKSPPPAASAPQRQPPTQAQLKQRQDEELMEIRQQIQHQEEQQQRQVQERMKVPVSVVEHHKGRHFFIIPGPQVSGEYRLVDMPAPGIQAFTDVPESTFLTLQEFTGTQGFSYLSCPSKPYPGCFDTPQLSPSTYVMGIHTQHDVLEFDIFLVYRGGRPRCRDGSWINAQGWQKIEAPSPKLLHEEQEACPISSFSSASTPLLVAAPQSDILWLRCQTGCSYPLLGAHFDSPKVPLIFLRLNLRLTRVSLLTPVVWLINIFPRQHVDGARWGLANNNNNNNNNNNSSSSSRNSNAKDGDANKPLTNEDSHEEQQHYYLSYSPGDVLSSFRDEGHGWCIGFNETTRQWGRFRLEEAIADAGGMVPDLDYMIQASFSGSVFGQPGYLDVKRGEIVRYIINEGQWSLIKKRDGVQGRVPKWVFGRGP